MPLSLLQILGALFRAYFRLAPKVDPEKLTLGEWARHFLGIPTFNFLIVPFTRGIYGAEPDEISVSAAFPMLCVPRGHSLISFMLAKMIRKKIGKTPPRAIRREQVIMPRGSVSAPENGMGEWVQALTTHLARRLGQKFQRSRSVRSLNEFSDVRNLILTIPAHEAARILQPESPELAQALAKVKYAPLVSATIFVRTQDFKKLPRGVGVLIPGTEKRHCLGILFNSSAFQNRVFPTLGEGGASVTSLTSLTMMLGGSSNPKILHEPDSALRTIIKNELREVLDFHGALLEVVIHRWPRAVPQYNHELLQTWELAQETWCAKPGRLLFGNYTGQVSLRGMIELAANHLPKTST